MNQLVIQSLSEKWSKEGIPHKGSSFGTNCSPCAQTAAVMEANKVSFSEIMNLFPSPHVFFSSRQIDTKSLDIIAAKSLGISVTHSILLRVVNDYVSGSPSAVLSNPEEILGPNWQKVLDFWHYVDSLDSEFWVKKATKISLNPDKGWSLKDKVSLDEKIEKLGVREANLAYPNLGESKEPVPLEEILNTEFHSKEILPPFNAKIHRKGFLGWAAAQQYGQTFLSFWIESGKISIYNFPERSDFLASIVAYATAEIQTDSYKESVFCSIMDYDPDKFSKEPKPFSLPESKMRDRYVPKNYDLEVTNEDLLLGDAFDKIFQGIEGIREESDIIYILTPNPEAGSIEETKLLDLLEKLKIERCYVFGRAVSSWEGFFSWKNLKNLEWGIEFPKTPGSKG